MNPDVKPPSSTHEPPSQPVQPQPSQSPPAPMQPIEPVGPPPVASNNKKRGMGVRFWVVVAAAVLIVISAVGVAAYTIYNQPDRVVRNALKSFIEAESSAFDGTVAYESQAIEGESQGKLTVSINGQGDNRATQINYDASVDFAPASLNLKGSAITDNESGDLYLKVDDTRQILGNVMGQDVASSPEFSQFVEKIDNKWIHFTQEAEEEGDDDSLSCALDVLDEFSGNSSQLNELLGIYDDNQFVTVENELGTEQIGGSTSRGFQLGYDEQKAKEFGSAAQSTELGKRLADCLDKSEATDDDDGTSPEVTVKIWADRWSHSLTRLEVEAQGEDFGSLNVRVDFQLDQPAEVNIPTEDVTKFEDIEEELQGLMFLLVFSGFAEEELDFDFEMDPFSTT